MGSRLGPSGGGTEEGLLSLCQHLCKDWALEKPEHETRTLSSDIPVPCQRLSLLLPLLPSPKPEEVGLVPLCAAPSPTSLCEPGTPWVALGAELEVLTKGQLRPVTCAAVGGPRSEGPRDHVREVQGCS